MKMKNYSCQNHQKQKLEGKQKFRSKTAAMAKRLISLVIIIIKTPYINTKKVSNSLMGKMPQNGQYSWLINM